MLKFDRKEERRGHVDAVNFETLLVRAAPIDVVGPEWKTDVVRLAVEKVEIMLPDKKVGCGQGTRSSRDVVVNDRNDRGCWITERCPRRTGERDAEGFISLQESIINDRYADRF